MNKRKQAVDLTDLALGIVVLGVTVAIGAVILLGVRDSRLTDLPTYATYNETITGNNATSQPLANTWVKNVDTVYNATDGAVVGSGNYTLSVNSGTGVGSVLVNGAEFNGSSLNVSYTSYNTSSPEWSVADSAATGLAEYGNWFKIIVIVGVAAVVLSLIFMAFGNRSSQSDISY